MGKTATKINIWNADWKIKEVLSASNIELFSIKNLKEISNKQFTLSEVDDGTFLVEFSNGDFTEFK